MTRCNSWFSITLVVLVVSMGMILFFLPKPSLLHGLSFSRAVYDEGGHLLRLTLNQDAKYRLQTPLAEMSPTLVAATLLQEDRYFYWHLGVNPFALLKATWQTYVLKSRRMGGSTITMQVARMRFGLHSKTVSGKIEQMLRAFQLERHYSKDEILEAYLNLAPYGNNVEGVGAASRIYFAKSAKALSLPEALTLVVIPQNPSKRAPDRGMLKDIRNKLYARWVRQHPEDSHKRAMMHLPLQMLSVRAMPFLAPHFVDTVLADLSIQKNEIVTTLDLRLQQTIERVMRRYLARKMNVGVNNAVVLLVDTRDMSVKAMLGSADFFNHKISGQINGTTMKRSPGSTLKPFIYALALDQGLIHPATVLKDVPRSFGSYNPENFDYDFAGPIKAQDALILSRNIPAVYLADQLKGPSLYELLQQAGINHLKPASYYGLSLVLGGAELSMQELTTLYAALANDGILRPLRFSNEQSINSSKRLFSLEASFLTLEMLKETEPPASSGALSSDMQRAIAWKTGTSSGFRDAWSIGIVGSYAIAVWLGNFNNQSHPALIGKEMAAPLFFDIVHAIHKEWLPLSTRPHQLDQRKLVKVDVCKASGMLPTRYCIETEKVWFMPGKSPIKTDTIHREVAINTKTGLRTCQFNQDTRFDIYEFWSSDLLKIFKRAGIARRLPPPYDATCDLHAKTNAGFHPQITTPHTNVSYIARYESNKATLIPFTAVVDADVRHLHWFINEIYVGKTTRDKAYLWKAKPGSYTVRVVDDYGRADARDLSVTSEMRTVS
jgi:penicillin-binding protein 1C